MAVSRGEPAPKTVPLVPRQRQTAPFTAGRLGCPRPLPFLHRGDAAHRPWALLGCRNPVLNGIFFVLVAGSVLTAAFDGTMPRVTEASLAAARSAVELAIGLIGQMALWLGFFGIVREGGLMRSIARGLRPLMRRLFPEVPEDHPAMGPMILNLAANMLGLGNAATPFGLKAMAELNTLNRYPGVATNPMALFIALNAAGVAILPLGAVAVRAALGSKDPAGIVLPSFLSTFSAAATAVVVAKLLERRPRFPPSATRRACGRVRTPPRGRSRTRRRWRRQRSSRRPTPLRRRPGDCSPCWCWSRSWSRWCGRQAACRPPHRLRGGPLVHERVDSCPS